MFFGTKSERVGDFRLPNRSPHYQKLHQIRPCDILIQAFRGREVSVCEADERIHSSIASKENREKKKRMPKLKTHSGAAKRFSKTGTGKIKRGQTKTRHILTSKAPKTKRKLGKTLLVSDGDYKKVARMIPYA